MNPGTKLVSKHVKYSTTQKTNLAVGCYRVKEPNKDQERILIIRDDDKAGLEANPVVVTELERDKRQISVGKTGNGNSANIVNLEEGEVPSCNVSVTSGSTAPKKNAKNNPAGASKKKSKNNYDDDDLEMDEELSDITYSDDSDDPAWGRKKKKKNNDVKGKKKKKKY